jgi:hypothetical protein
MESERKKCMVNTGPSYGDKSFSTSKSFLRVVLFLIHNIFTEENLFYICKFSLHKERFSELLQCLEFLKTVN